jgi:hypothetical protein
MSSSDGVRAGSLNASLSRRRMLGIGGGLTASMLLGDRLAGHAFAQGTPAASGAPVSPAAANGELEEQEIRVLLFSGPENDAHKRLAPQFTE